MGTVKKIDLRAMLDNMKPKTTIETSVPNPYKGPEIKDTLIDFPLQLDPMTYGELDVMAISLGQPTKEVGIMALQLGIVEINRIVRQKMGLEEGSLP